VKDDFDNETKKAQSLEKTKKALETDLEDTKDQVEVLNDQKSALEKSKKKLEDEVEELKVTHYVKLILMN
jgi:predicted nuclease with TOPRIM domain